MTASTYPTYPSGILGYTTQTTDLEPVEYDDVGVQRVREGDILVFRSENRLPADVIRKLRESIAKQLGENAKFIVLENGIHIETVLRPDEDEEDES